MCALDKGVRYSPICWCGHDFFYHDIVMITPAKENGGISEVDITVCHEEGCECESYYSTTTWMNALWECIKKCVEDYENGQNG